MSKLTYSNFHTKVLFDSTLVIADAFSISENQNILESSCGYGGKIKGENIGVASPYIIGFGDVTANLSFNPTENHITKLKDWIADRNSSKSIVCENSAQGILTYGESYFSSIALSASENSLVNCDLELWMYKNALTSGKIGGDVTKESRQNLSENDKNVIPFWKTSISGFPLEVISWNVDINQNLTKKFYCDGLVEDSDVPLPKDVFVGPLNIDLNVTAIIPSETYEIKSLTDELNLEIKFGNTSLLSISKVKIISISPDLTDKGGRFVTLSYKVFKLNLEEK